MMAPRRGRGTPKKSGDEEDSVMRQLEINYGKLKKQRARRSKETTLHHIFSHRVEATLKLLFKQCYLSRDDRGREGVRAQTHGWKESGGAF